jgi:hypothetical protein
VVGIVTRLLATALAVVLAQHVLAGTAIDLGAHVTLVAPGVLLVCAGLGLRSRRRVPYLGDGVVVALLVPLRGPVCDAVGFVAPSGPAAASVAALISLGPLSFALGRQLGGCLDGGLPPVLFGLAGGQLLLFAGAGGWLPSWALGAVVAASLATLSELGRPRHEELSVDEPVPVGLFAGAVVALWVVVLARITANYTEPSAWATDDALLVVLSLSALVAWPACALRPRPGHPGRRILAGLGALALAVVLWSSISELAVYRDPRRSVDLARKLFDHAARLDLVGVWWFWLVSFAGLRAAALGLLLGALDARALGALALGAGLAALGLAWLPFEPLMLPATALLLAVGLSLAAVPVACVGRRGLFLLPLVGLPFLLLPGDERPAFDEIRRQGEFGIQLFERAALVDLAVFATPDTDSVSSEGRRAAGASCTCERTALTLTRDGGLARSIDARPDPERPCYGVRIAGTNLHAGHDPLGPAGSVGRLLRLFGPTGDWLVSGVGAELFAADLLGAGLAEELTVATSVPLGAGMTFTLLDALGSRERPALAPLDPLQASRGTGAQDLDGVLVPPQPAAWSSEALHASREHLARLARRLLPGGRCLLFIDTGGLDVSALDARLAAFGAVFGERCAVFVEPREQDAPFVLALGWVDEQGQPERQALAGRVAGLDASPLRTRLEAPEDLASLLLRDGRGMQAGTERTSPARRARPAPVVRWHDTGWAAVAGVADEQARLDRVVRGAEGRAEGRASAAPDVLAGLALHETYEYRLRDLNETTFFVPEDVDWTRFDAEVALYVTAAARDPADPLLQLALAALLEPLAMEGDYGRFARVYQACGAERMRSVRLALLEAWVQQESLEEQAAEAALERARRLSRRGD